MASDPITGQCLCGTVAFSGAGIAGAGVEVCHCRNCRRWGGGPFMSVRLAGGVTLTAGAPVWHASSDWAERGFCGACGTSMFWRLAGEPLDWIVNVHTLGDGHGLAINEHIWVDQKPGFYEFSDTTPRLTEAEFMARHQGTGE
ncbi:MAG: GFA family protein [Paracoccaceae bacterium]